MSDMTATIADQHAMRKREMKPSSLVPTMYIEHHADKCMKMMTNVVTKVIEEAAMANFCAEVRLWDWFAWVYTKRDK